MGSDSTSNSQFPGFSSQAPMTPEQQAFLQTQQKVFIAFQQNFQNIQANPPRLTPASYSVPIQDLVPPANNAPEKNQIRHIGEHRGKSIIPICRGNTSISHVPFLFISLERLRRIYEDGDALHILRDEMDKGMSILYQLVFAYDADNSANITFILRPTENVTHLDADIVSVLKPTENVLRGWVNCKVTRPDADIVSVLRPTENVLRGWVRDGSRLLVGSGRQVIFGLDLALLDDFLHKNSGNGRNQRNRGQQSNRSANFGASGRVFAITEDHTTKTSEICEEFHTSSGPSDSGGNPPPVTIHTWLERFNKQKPRSFEKATASVDVENWISHMEKIFDVMGSYKQAKGGDTWLITMTWVEFKKLFFLQFFPRAEQERLKREYHSICQTNTKTSTVFMQRFLRLAGFLGAAADVAQVTNAARNYEILHERDDDDAERPDKRQKSGDRHQSTTQQSSHRNHGHNNDRHGSDRRGGGDNHRSSNNNYSGNNNMLNFKSIQSSSTHKHDPNITVPSSPGVPLRATPTRSALRVDADTQESVVELLVPASSVVKLAICRRIARRTPLDHATKTS
nr:hypothetical protein [Tanacetum cinerariifolium]